jgi:hypothetical protein
VEGKTTTKGTTDTTDHTKIVQVTRTKIVQVARIKIMPPKLTAAKAWPWSETTSGQVTSKGKKAMEGKNSAAAQRSR